MGSLAPPLKTNVVSYGANVTLAENGVQSLLGSALFPALITPGTFVRTGELILAQWSEFDRREKLWSIPAERMKMRRPHLVPLSRQVLAVRDELWERRKHDVWVFPGARSCPYMNKNSMLCALKRMGYKGEMTGHGFRGLASTILNVMGYERAHIEMQLARAPKNDAEAAYNQGTLPPSTSGHDARLGGLPR